MDHFYYKKIGVLKDQEFIYKDALTRLKSVEELDKEYKNWVDGVKDSHDLIVHNWKMAIADKMRQEEERLETAQNDMFKFNYEESDFHLVPDPGFCICQQPAGHPCTGGHLDCLEHG